MIYAQRFGEVCRKALNKKERRQWAMEKPKLDNARTWRGFYYYQDTLVPLKPTTLRERTLAKPEARDQKDLIAEKGLFSLTHYNLAHKPKPTPSCNENFGHESRSRQRVGEARKAASMAGDEGQEQHRDHREGTKREMDSSFCHADGLMPPQELGVGAEVQKK